MFSWVFLAFAFVGLVFGLPSGPVTLWSVQDVQSWVKNDIGYPQYSDYFLAQLVDGPTLLYLSPKDLETEFKISNKIHLAKFAAHLHQIQSTCASAARLVAPNSLNSLVGPSDFWSYMALYPRRVFFWGLMTMYAPRTATVGVFLFDRALYKDITYVSSVKVAFNVSSMSESILHTQTPSFVRQLLYWTFGLTFPSTYHALLWMPYFWLNPVVVATTLGNLIISQHWEIITIVKYFQGELFTEKDTLIDKVMYLVPVTTLMPMILGLITYIAPLVLLKIIMGLFIIFSVVCFYGFIIVLRGGPKQLANRKSEEETPTEEAKKEK